MNKKIIIAVDGYASCGKSTLAKALAQQLGYKYLDSGAMYRAVTLFTLEEQIDFHDHRKVIQSLPDIHIDFRPTAVGIRTLLNGRDVESEIRSMEVSNIVSQIAIIPEVRTKLVQIQRTLGNGSGIAMDGRDIGTVVFPEAELKLFITAEMEERVRRRHLQLQEKGIPSTLSAIRRNLYLRDYIDTTRSKSPLSKAKEAVIIDNTNLTPEEQLAIGITLVKSRVNTTLTSSQ